MKYKIVYLDPPWYYPPTSTYNKTGASSHYPLMTDNDLLKFDIHKFLDTQGAVFMWATSPRLDFALECLKSWKLVYKGIAFIWIKTNKTNGEIMGAKGPPPSFVKPVSEYVLAATPKGGRGFELLDSGMRQIIFANRSAHSEKPPIVREKIVQLCGDLPRIELFARGVLPEGWDGWGNEYEE